MYNIISLDTSKTSTGLRIKSNKGEFLVNFTTKKQNYKWIKHAKSLIECISFEYNKDDDYAKNEYNNMLTYSEISQAVLEKCLEYIDENEDTYIAMEGYSFSSKTNSILNLVEIGQSIRLKLYENLPNLKDFRIIAPTEVKKLVCEMTYGYSEVIKNKGRKNEKIVLENNKNPFGISGGKFQKPDMYQALLDLKINDGEFKNYLIENEKELCSRPKTVKKPVEDILDSIWIGYILEYYFLPTSNPQKLINN